MKKIIAGFVAGALLFGAVPAFADTVKSLVGAKVTGVYTVEQDGKKIADGAVINGSTYVPVRAVANATGTEIKVEGKTIILGSSQVKETAQSTENKYSEWSKEKLENKKHILEEKILAPTQKGRDELLKSLESMKLSGSKEAITDLESNIKGYEDEITKYTKELEQVNEALKALEK